VTPVLNRHRPHIYGVIYAEDFDDISPTQHETSGDLPPEPVEIVSPLTIDDVVQAEQRARAEGFEAGVEHALTSEEMAAAAKQTLMLETICTQLIAQQEMLAALQGEQIRRITNDIIEALETLFPDLCARFGDAEAVSVADGVLNVLARHLTVEIRVAPAAAARMEAYLASTYPERDMNIISDETMGFGDVRLNWPDGYAMRNHTEIADAILSSLVAANAKPTKENAL